MTNLEFHESRDAQEPGASPESIRSTSPRSGKALAGSGSRRTLRFIRLVGAAIGVIALMVSSMLSGETVRGRTWDLQEARHQLAAAREAPVDSKQLVEALLSVAEILRLDYEGTEESAREARRQLGEEIDILVESGDQLLQNLEENAERERLRADFLFLRIRTPFRAKKYGQRFKDAAESALQLDPNNAEAWATSAKSYLFADPNHGGDVEEARRRLKKALELDPRLETAHLMEAEALRRLGEVEAAKQVFREVLELYPECRPARIALESLEVEP